MVMRARNSRNATLMFLLLASVETADSFCPSIRTHALGSLKATSPDEENPVTATMDKRQGVLDDARDEASDALSSVGWSSPIGDGDMSADDPFVQRIDAQVRLETGVGLEELLNPAKVVNLERDLYNLRIELANLTSAEIEGNSMRTDTSYFDGGGGGEGADKIRSMIEKKEGNLFVEQRSVFRGWLKNVFLGQAVLSLALSWVMVTNPATLFGGFDAFTKYDLDTPIRVLGFWWWWLFIVPSLRSRRPGGVEKKALDIAFLATPAISLIGPVATKDTVVLWFANFLVVCGSYAFAYSTDGDGGGGENKPQPEWLKFVYSSLDFGAGKERGIRK